MVASTELQRIGTSGWRTGLANLLRKENRAWWASRRWLVQSVVWTVIVNGLTVFTAFIVPALAKGLGQPVVGFSDPRVAAADVLFKLGALALAVGAIILVDDAIIGERQLGVTEWLLSKPVSRSAYVLSKLFAHGLGILVILVGLQSALGYVVLSAVGGEPFPLPLYLVGVAGLAVHTFFYLALTLMMGVVAASRRVLLGVALGTLLGGMMVIQFLGMAVGKFALVTPWALSNVLSAAVLGLPLPVSIWVPIGVTAILSVIFVAVTLVRFERLEF